MSESQSQSPGSDPSTALLGADVPDGAMELAVSMADAATDIASRYFRQSFSIEGKADKSPVTIADKETETAMRRMIAEHYPEHGILGEEHGTESIDSTYVWVLDPIDGTASFATGYPVFGAMIALLENGVPILGIIDCSQMNERWIGARGRPTTFNGEIVKTRACPTLDVAWCSASLPDMFHRDGEWAASQRLRSACFRTTWGLNCYAYGLVANGTLDLVCESDLYPFDYMATVPIIEGAGGRVTTWTGDPVTLESGPQVLAAGDPALHDVAVGVLVG